MREETKANIRKFRALFKNYKSHLRVELSNLELEYNPRMWQTREAVCLSRKEQAILDIIWNFLKKEPNTTITNIYLHFSKNYDIIVDYGRIKYCLLILWIKKKIYLKNYGKMYEPILQRIILRDQYKNLT